MTDSPPDENAAPARPTLPALAFRPAPVPAPPPAGEPAQAAEQPAQAAEPEAAPEQDLAGAPERRAPSRPRAGLLLNVALLLASAGLAVALALTLLGGNDDNALESARTSALAAARTYSVELAGYDYRHLTQDFGVVLAHSTPSFRKTFSESSSALAPTLTKYRATATAKVVAAGVVTATTSQVVVLVLLDQTVTNSTQKAPTVDRSQIEITLVPSGGRWLINQVSLL